MTVYVKGVAHIDKSTENYNSTVLFSSTERFSIFKLIMLFPATAGSCEKAVIN